MSDYISREAAIEVLCDACGNAACPKGLIQRCSYYERMQAIPAADVRPVAEILDRLDEERKKAKGQWHTDRYWLGWVDAMR